MYNVQKVSFRIQILVEQWIFAKYAREEFLHPERQSYTSGVYMHT